MTVEFIDPPPGSSDEEQLDSGLPRRPRWLWLVLAAVFVAAATGYGIKVAHGHGHEHSGPPLAQQPIKITVHPGPAVPIGKTTCRATVPATWRAAARAATTPITARMNVFGVTDDASVVGVWQSKDAFTVRLVATGAHRVRDLATFPRTSTHDNAFAEVDGEDVLVTLGRAAKNSFRLTRVVVIDARSGAQTPIPALGGPGHVEQAELLHGAVYWGRIQNSDGQSLTVYQYDLSTKRTVTVFHGTDALLERSAAGIGLSGPGNARLTEPAGLPPKVLVEPGATENWASLKTDGSSYAWTAHNYIAWWSQATGISRFHVGNAYVIGVAGPLVFFVGRSPKVSWLDVRTGAVARQRLTSFTSSDGRLITTGDPLEAGTASDELMRLDTSTLPPLTC